MMLLSSLPFYCRSFLTCSRRVRGKNPRENFNGLIARKQLVQTRRNELRLCPALLALGQLWDIWRAFTEFQKGSWVQWDTVREGCQDVGSSCCHPSACTLELPCSQCPSLAHQVAPDVVCRLPHWHLMLQLEASRMLCWKLQQKFLTIPNKCSCAVLHRHEVV